MLINIYGLSGSGKTFFIRDILRKEKINYFFNNVSGLNEGLNSINSTSITLFPIPLFKGDVSTLLDIYSIKMSDLLSHNEKFYNLAKSIFGIFTLDDLPQIKKRQIESLSAGEIRRLFILKSLLVKSDIVIIDEPFSNSDEGLWKNIYESIQDVPKSIVLSHKPLDLVFKIKVEHKIINIKDIKEMF